MELVADIKSGIIEVERIRVLHDELSAAQDARPRAGLISVLDLNLVEHDGQVFVGRVHVFHHVGKHFLVRRPEQVVATASIFQPKKCVTVFRPAIGGLVGFAGQKAGEQHFLAAHFVHFLSHDPSDVLHHDLAEGQP